MNFCLYVLKTLMFLSSLAVMMDEPSWVNLTSRTVPVCALKTVDSPWQQQHEGSASCYMLPNGGLAALEAKESLKMYLD